VSENTVDLNATVIITPLTLNLWSSSYRLGLQGRDAA